MADMESDATVTVAFVLGNENNANRVREVLGTNVTNICNFVKQYVVSALGNTVVNDSNEETVTTYRHCMILLEHWDKIWPGCFAEGVTVGARSAYLYAMVSGTRPRWGRVEGVMRDVAVRLKEDGLEVAFFAAAVPSRRLRVRFPQIMQDHHHFCYACWDGALSPDAKLATMESVLDEASPGTARLLCVLLFDGAAPALLENVEGKRLVNREGHLVLVSDQE